MHELAHAWNRANGTQAEDQFTREIDAARGALIYENLARVCIDPGSGQRDAYGQDTFEHVKVQCPLCHFCYGSATYDTSTNSCAYTSAGFCFLKADSATTPPTFLCPGYDNVACNHAQNQSCFFDDPSC